jgi:hypothetical protein
LKQAATFGEKAFVIITEHGTNLPDYSLLLSKVYQWLGLIYGELGLEGVEKEVRETFQSQAVVMLSKAIHLQKRNATLRYQLALAMIEIGEFEQAAIEVQHATTYNPNCPSFYNLLALMLSSQKQYEKAMQIATAGWKVCVEQLCPKENVKISEAERLVNWELVETPYKDELFNLRLTILSIEMQSNGPVQMIDQLQKSFALLRRIIGIPPSLEEPKKEEEGRLSRRVSVPTAYSGLLNSSIVSF